MNPDNGEFDGVVLVTGAASGIGLATAATLARTGGTIVLADRDPAALARAACNLVPEPAARVVTEAADVTEFDEVARLIDLTSREGTLRGVVNCAGTVALGTVYDVTPDAWDATIAVNLTAVYYVCRAALPLLDECQGAIVNLASIAGRTRSTYSAPSYVAAKAGVIGLTMSLAAQHAHKGVRINCVAPGVIDTPMLATYSADQKQTLASSVPLGRLGSAQEVADAIVFLLSPGASYMTGQCINVNGGQFMM
jgi:NAD(P)-dependent dehydrogenase (short-subunit alcohol dehydrogenase family)